jgi:hypothetical protein
MSDVTDETVEVAALIRRLHSMAVDMDNTDGWNYAAVDVRDAAKRIAALSAAPPAQNTAVEAEPVAFRERDLNLAKNKIKVLELERDEALQTVEALECALAEIRGGTDTLAARDARIAELDEELNVQQMKESIALEEWQKSKARITAREEELQRVWEVKHTDELAVDRFAAAMKAKLAKKRVEGRGGWEDKDQCSAVLLSGLLRDHVDKGDPLDVGNLAMMLHQRDERIV